MPSRMDRYKTNNNLESRAEKNEQLYKDVYNNRMYTKFTDVNTNFVDITHVNHDSKKREDIHKYGFNLNRDIEVDKKIKNNKLSDDDLDIYTKKYNVNDILKEAKENRKIEDPFEKSKKLRSAEYNILSDLSYEKLAEYRKKKEKPLSLEEEEEVVELVNTITSNTMHKEIEESLLKDLLPDSDTEEVISKDVLSQLEKMDINDDKYEKDEEIENTNIDKSFYTRSMDLKKEDLLGKEDTDKELDYEMDDSFKEKKSSLKIIIILLLLLVILGVTVFVVFKVI